MDNNTILLLKCPSRLQRYLAEEVYYDTLRKAELNGSYNHEDYMTLLDEKGFWNYTKQQTLDGLTKDIEELKFALYKSTYKSEQRKTIRKALAKAKEEQTRLMIQLHEYDYMSAAGVAVMAKARYIIAASLHRFDGSQLYRDDELWLVSENVIEQIASIIAEYKLNESQVREIARTDPWRTLWISRKAESNVFGVPAVDLNEEQRLLSIWSDVYDNVYNHPECPGESVINDDDMMDGWMIAQKRKREAEREGAAADGLVTNEKIREHEEIFIPVDTVEDARKISQLNDAGVNMLKRKREALINEKGVVSETDMPDSQMKIRAELNRRFIEQVKG